MTIQGQVDNLGKQTLGWVYDADLQQPQTVTLFVQGVAVKTLRPMYIRKPISPTVLTGFRYRITSDLRPYIHSLNHISLKAGGVDLPVAKCDLKIYSRKRWRPIGDLKEKMAKGYFFTKKGELILELNQDLEWQKRIFDFYDHARKVFKDVTGYELFATAGTLLGYAREGGFIGSDDDFDTSYISQHTDVRKVRAEVLRIIAGLAKAGEKIELTKRRTFFYWRSRDGKSSLDVFPAWISKTMFYHTFAIGGPHAKVFSQGMKEVYLKGRPILIPKAHEEACAAIYGPGWRTPDPLFQWAVPAAVQKQMKKMKISKKRFLKAIAPPPAPEEGISTAGGEQASAVDVPQ